VGTEYKCTEGKKTEGLRGKPGEKFLIWIPFRLRKIGPRHLSNKKKGSGKGRRREGFKKEPKKGETKCFETTPSAGIEVRETKTRVNQGKR